MVEDIKEFTTELCVYSLAESERLHNREVPIVKTGSTKSVPPKIAKCTHSRWYQQRTSLRIAAETAQGTQQRWRICCGDTSCVRGAREKGHALVLSPLDICGITNDIPAIAE